MGNYVCCGVRAFVQSLALAERKEVGGVNTFHGVTGNHPVTPFFIGEVSLLCVDQN